MVTETVDLADHVGILAVTAAVGVAALLVSLSALPRLVKQLLYIALALRVVGSLGRFYMVTELYGRGDSLAYFERGVAYAERFWVLDFSPFWDVQQWTRSAWLGTQFQNHVSGVVHAFVGPSLLGGFLAFSLLAFVGLVGFGVAFARAFPGVPVTNYLRWAWLFPSLWFWPSAIGKEAILVLGLGVATWGYVGRHGRVNWVLLAVGLFFVFSVRPPVAAVVAVSFVLAYWLSLFRDRWTLATVVQAALMFGGGLAFIWVAMDRMGVGSFDVDGVQTYIEESKGRDVGGGSAVGGVQVGLAGVPLAIVNILFRPFVWEARSVAMLISAIEIAAFWAIVWYRREALRSLVRSWRTHRLIGAALSFVLLYSITLGMAVSNLGIIARQRIFLFPFLFILLEATPGAASALRRPIRSPRQTGAVGRTTRFPAAASPRPAHPT